MTCFVSKAPRWCWPVRRMLAKHVDENEFGLRPLYSHRRRPKAHELWSKLLVSPLLTPFVVPYIIPYIRPP